MECAARGSGTPCTPGRTSRRCGACGAVAYCSTAHQVSHWNAHKEECARLEEQMKHADALNDFPFTFSTDILTQLESSLYVEIVMIAIVAAACQVSSVSDALHADAEIVALVLLLYKLLFLNFLYNLQLEREC